MEAVPGKADGKRSLALAERLARAMGAELVWRERPRRLEIRGFPGPYWSRPGNVLRWARCRGADVGRWLGSGLQPDLAVGMLESVFGQGTGGPGFPGSWEEMEVVLEARGF